jgi:hypothetical protein
MARQSAPSEPPMTSSAPSFSMPPCRRSIGPRHCTLPRSSSTSDPQNPSTCAHRTQPTTSSLLLMHIACLWLSLLPQS